MENAPQGKGFDHFAGRDFEDDILETPLLVCYHACRSVPDKAMLKRRRARKKYVDILDGGSGYETLLKLRERFHGHLDKCENEINRAIQVCRMPEPPEEINLRSIAEASDSLEWFGSSTRKEAPHRLFMTAPPLQKGFRFLNVTQEGLREAPVEGQDPNDPAFFYLTQHRSDLLRLSSHASSHSEWKLRLNVLQNVVEEFEWGFEAEAPQTYFDFSEVGREAPAFLRKVKAIKEVLEERPELKDANANAPIFRAIVEEDLYITDAEKPENTIRRNLKSNFEDFFDPVEFPTTGKGWGHFFEPNDEGAGVLEKERSQ